MNIRYGVNITTWRGYGPAVHWYGKAWRYNSDAPHANRRSEFDEAPAKDDTDTYLWTSTIARVLSGSEARSMNESDDDRMMLGSLGLKAGDPTQAVSTTRRM